MSSACGTTINVTVREPFTLLLEENPTTGYRWNIDVDTGLEVISSEYARNNPTRIGGGGVRRFVLLTDKAGEYKLRAKLWRQWLGDSSTTKRCEITVRST